MSHLQAIVLLALGTYALRWAGLNLVPRLGAARVRAVVAAILAGLVVLGTVTDGRALVADARLPAVAVAAVLAARGWPLIAVLVAATATAAVIRALAG